MMKPPFKASDCAINVIHAPWFDRCTVWFVASLSCINMTLKYVTPTCAIYIRLIITSPSSLVPDIPLGDYKLEYSTPGMT